MSAEIKYNGNVIASPGAGQKATLKCEGMKMDSDVVVEVAENTGGGEAEEPIIEPLEVTENGSYTAPDGVDGYSPVVVNVETPKYSGYVEVSKWQE